jgi:hypothetical protein
MSRFDKERADKLAPTRAEASLSGMEDTELGTGHPALTSKLQGIGGFLRRSLSSETPSTTSSSTTGVSPPRGGLLPKVGDRYYSDIPVPTSKFSEPSKTETSLTGLGKDNRNIETAPKATK